MGLPKKVTPVAGEPARGSRVVCTVREGADPDRFSRSCLSTGQERCGCRGVSSHRCQGLSSLGEGSVGTRRLRDVDGFLPDPKGGGRSAGGIDVQASRSRIRRSRLGRVGFFRKFRIVDGSGGRRARSLRAGLAGGVRRARSSHRTVGRLFEVDPGLLIPAGEAYAHPSVPAFENLNGLGPSRAGRSCGAGGRGGRSGGGLRHGELGDGIRFRPGRAVLA